MEVPLILVMFLAHDDYRRPVVPGLVAKQSFRIGGEVKPERGGEVKP